MASTINASTAGGGGIISSADSSGVLQLQTAGTTAVTVDASQNVGIGTASPGAKLDVNGSISASGATVVGNYIVNRAFATAITSAGSLAVQFDGTTQGYISSPATSALAFYTSAAGTERMRIDSSGNVGIGTSSPGTKLDVSGNLRFSAANPVIELNNGGAQVYSTAANTLQFAIGGGIGSAIERMRIDSSGTVLMGQTTNPATATLVLKVSTGSANGVNAQITSNTGTSYPWSNYNASGTYVGGISCTSTSTAFPTSSDVRLKKNIEDAPSAIDKVLNTQVVSHDWINDDAHVEYGFIAQDLQKIIPQAVIEGTDKEDGSVDMPWGVDYSKIVPLLTKSIQELKAIVDTQAEQIKALQGAK